MALDYTLLEAAPMIRKTVLRFYSWSEAAATFGYFQKFSEVERMTTLRPLVRRPTGGGLVPHDADWTYSLIVPPSADWYRLKAVESYRRLHEWIQAAFHRAGFKTDLSPDSFRGTRGQCFAGPEQFDLVWQERKMAGAAQRRTRQGLLVQGSIQPPPGLARSIWETAFCEVAAEQWGVEWQPWELGPELERQVQKLARQKYATSQYNRQR